MKKLFSLSCKFGVLALFLSFCCFQVSAQFKSAIAGTVTDSSGGVVGDAPVTLTNVDTRGLSSGSPVGSHARPAIRFIRT